MGWYGIIRTSPPVCMGRSDYSDSHCLGTLGSLLDLELNALILLERAEAASADLGKVDEHVRRAAVRSDEAEAFVAVEPFHSSLCHLLTSLIQCGCTKNIRAGVYHGWRDNRKPLAPFAFQ